MSGRGIQTDSAFVFTGMKLHPLILSAFLLLDAATASAHDTWFATRPGKPAEVVLALGTGDQFPAFETGIDARYFTAQGCDAGGQAAAVPMVILRNDDRSLLLRAPRNATSCWMQLQPFEITVTPDKVPVYLKEIQASPEVRATWSAMQARGLPWRERYVKHARIDLDPGAATATATGVPALPLGMDLRIEHANGPLRVGDSVNARVLRDGLPLADQALELRSDASPLGIWRRSDEQGRLTLPLPLAGRWLLRGVDLRVSASNPDEWDSRFVTLAFEVLPRR